MHNVLVFDIETVRDENSPGLISSLFSRVDAKGDGRIKDPEKKEADRQEKIDAKKEELVEKFGLSPLTGKIICFTYWSGQDSAVSGDCVEWDTERPTAVINKDEVVVLSQIQQSFAVLNQLSRLVTFNGKSFDMPYIRTRMAIANMDLFTPFRNAKYDNEGHFDVRTVLTNYDDMGRGTLHDWSLKFGIVSDDEPYVGGDQVQGWWDAGETQKIADKSIEDVIRTATLYNRLRRTNG